MRLWASASSPSSSLDKKSRHNGQCLVRVIKCIHIYRLGVLLNSYQNCLQHVRLSGQGAIVCNSRGVYHVQQHVVCHLVEGDSSPVKFDSAEIAFISVLFHWLKPSTDEGGEEKEDPPPPPPIPPSPPPPQKKKKTDDELQKIPHTLA